MRDVTSPFVSICISPTQLVGSGKWYTNYSAFVRRLYSSRIRCTLPLDNLVLVSECKQYHFHQAVDIVTIESAYRLFIKVRQGRELVLMAGNTLAS